jgi:hypothetical protein
MNLKKLLVFLALVAMAIMLFGMICALLTIFNEYYCVIVVALAYEAIMVLLYLGIRKSALYLVKLK